MKKRGQLKMSFGMLFSIILIMIFLGFAFYAILKLVDIMEEVTLKRFLDDFQNDVDSLWRAPKGSQPHNYAVPSGTEFVCFIYETTSGRGEKGEWLLDFKEASSGKENMFLYPFGDVPETRVFTINHLELAKITATENPYCIKVSNEKVQLTVRKESGESLPTITR